MVVVSQKLGRNVEPGTCGVWIGYAIPSPAAASLLEKNFTKYQYRFNYDFK